MTTWFKRHLYIDYPMTSLQVMGFFRLHFLFLFICIPWQEMLGASTDTKNTSCPVVKIETRRLPDLHVPRAGHCMLEVNGEMMVVGGHTTGFIPTATAEYYSEGEWHLLQTVYAHDDGLCVQLKSGKVLLGGGHEKHLGIGQTFPVEMYDPNSHSFDGFGCFSEKRAMASGVEIDSGKVMIVGNWYHDDAIELFDGEKNFIYNKGVSVAAPWPYLFRTPNDDVLILPILDLHGEKIISDVVDRLRGEPLHIPLLETWHPLIGWNNPISDCFIGNEEAGDYSYLFPVENNEGQVAIALVKNGDFSLLPTTCPVPMESQGEPILYLSPMVVDRQAKRGYLKGFGQKSGEKTKYFLCIDYGKKDAAQLTLYHTDEIQETEFDMLINSAGDLVISGGNTGDNFKPSSNVYILPFGNGNDVQRSSFALSRYIPWIVIGVVIVLLLLIYCFYRLRKRHIGNEDNPTLVIDESEVLQPTNHVLMESICKLMEERQLFLNSDLKVSDVAVELQTNSRYISDCIKLGKNTTFKQFVNGYRVDYAKQLMRQNPDMKLSVVGLKSGFSNEMTFYRTFKALTDKTPREWVMQLEKE